MFPGANFRPMLFGGHFSCFVPVTTSLGSSNMFRSKLTNSNCLLKTLIAASSTALLWLSARSERKISTDQRSRGSDVEHRLRRLL